MEAFGSERWMRAVDDSPSRANQQDVLVLGALARWAVALIGGIPSHEDCNSTLLIDNAGLFRSKLVRIILLVACVSWHSSAPGSLLVTCRALHSNFVNEPNL